MNPVRIENIAVNSVNNEIYKYDVLSSDIKRNDKKISIDGYIELYSSHKMRVGNLLGNIPVQIKGREVKQISNHSRIDTVKIEDLKNYKKDGKGAIYFVVEILPNTNTKIFYYNFSVKKINEILAHTKEGQKTKRIVLDELKQGELLEKVIELYNTWESASIEIKKIKRTVTTNMVSVQEDSVEQNRIREIMQENKVFVHTKSFKEAQEKLKKDNIVLLHGEPWVGKTTIANELVKEYYKNGYEFLYGRANELKEIEEKLVKRKNERIICLIDDFLGSNVNHLKNSELDTCLNDILKKFKKESNKKLILTTRTYIYNNAKELFHKFYQCTEEIDGVLVDVGDYTNIEKAQIVYKHLEKNNMLWTKNYMELLQGKYYQDIIKHKNFNPGMISHICETMNKIEKHEIKAYIENLLNNPNKIWEREYNKLNFYEQILLNIIVLFGYETLEEEIKEQFIAMLSEKTITKVETLQLEKEYENALSMLTTSFLKVGFNEENEKTLDTCKHSVRDYIIAKIKNKELSIEPYMKSANYIEILHYIDLYCEEEKEITEKLAQKVEEDYECLKESRYDKFSIAYSILERNLTNTRKQKLQERIKDIFEHNSIDEAIQLIDREDSVLYPYVIEQFKKYELDDLRNVPYFFDNPYRILLGISDVMEMNSYLKACYECVKKKNHKYMLDRIEDIEEILIPILLENVLGEVKEVIPEYTLELLEQGQTIEEISKEYVKDTIQDEITNLRLLYNNTTYNRIVEEISQSCKIEEEELELLEIDFKEIKKNIKKEKIVQKSIEEEKEKQYIQTLFEGEKELEPQTIKSTQWIIQYMIHNQKKKNTQEKIHRALQHWYLQENLQDDNFSKIDFLIELVEHTKVDLEKLSSFINHTLSYSKIKYKITKKQLEQIQTIAYKSFKRGNIEIEQKEITINDETLEELINTQLLERKDGKIKFSFLAIHLYLAILEVRKREDDLYDIINIWYEKDECDFLERIREIFAVCESISKQDFDDSIAIPLLEMFISDMEKAPSITPVEIAKRYFEETQILLDLSQEHGMIGEVSKIYEGDWILEYIGIDLHAELAEYHYGFEQGNFKEYYDKVLDFYQLNLYNMINDEEEKEKLENIGICNFLFTIYKDMKQLLEEMKQGKKIELFDYRNKKK